MGERESPNLHPLPWCQALYLRHSVEDNYVDPQFFNPIGTNVGSDRSYSYWSLVRGTVSVAQHLSLIGIFLAIWRLINCQTNQHSCGIRPISARELLVLDVSLLGFGYAVSVANHGEGISRLDGVSRLGGGGFLRSGIVSFGYLWMLSPVLQTLTKAFSDDTATACTSIFLLLHAILHEYSYTARRDGQVGSILAVNSGILAAVVLASRLGDTLEVFAFLFFSIEVFALSPILGQLLWEWRPKVYMASTVVLCLITAILLGYAVAAVVVVVYIAGILVITFGGPFWLVKAMKYKNEMVGPWNLPRVPVYD